MSKLGLYITFEPELGKPVTLAKVHDRELLKDAALSALSVAEHLVSEVEAQDKTLGELQRQEACRLRNALELVLPELRTQANPTGIM
jgi:hypothetical protein